MNAFLRTSLVASALLFAPFSADAFPWMVRHGYAGCGQCHADPSGGGLLTEYGRMQGEVLLRTPWEKRGEDWEPGDYAKQMLGTMKLPENFLVEAASRSTRITIKPDGAPAVNQFIQMQADLRAQYSVGRFRANGSMGVAPLGAKQAQVTGGNAGNLVSREHWLGYDATDRVLVRGGRMAMPFGIRDIVHTLWVRKATRTDINDAEQHGLAASYSGVRLRGEAMAIAGNYQVRPDAFRERGYSAFGEFAITPQNTIGVSSLMGHSKLDVIQHHELTRQAHGLFVRSSPWKPIVLLAEGDWLLEDDGPGAAKTGYTGMGQLDIEPIQGVHLLATGETLERDRSVGRPSYGVWGGLNWYFAPHMDARIDYARRTIPAAPHQYVQADVYLLQFHFFL